MIIKISDAITMVTGFAKTGMALRIEKVIGKKGERADVTVVSNVRTWTMDQEMVALEDVADVLSAYPEKEIFIALPDGNCGADEIVLAFADKRKAPQQPLPNSGNNQNQPNANNQSNQNPQGRNNPNGGGQQQQTNQPNGQRQNRNNNPGGHGGNQQNSGNNQNQPNANNQSNQNPQGQDNPNGTGQQPQQTPQQRPKKGIFEKIWTVFD